jgi:hypothetical protein
MALKGGVQALIASCQRVAEKLAKLPPLRS